MFNLSNRSIPVKFLFIISALLFLPTLVSAAYQHRVYDYCSNHGGILYTIDHSVSTWGDCRDWCDPYIEANHNLLCQQNGSGTLCWVNNPPAGGIATCTWEGNTGNHPYGAWWSGNETPTPTPTPILGQSHRTGEDYCYTATAKARAYTSTQATWDSCLAWCDTKMTMEYPICQWTGWSQQCDVYFPPTTGLAGCTWTADYWNKGAWLADLEPPSYQIANLDTNLDAYKTSNSGLYFHSSRIEVGDSLGLSGSNDLVSLAKNGATEILGTVYADFTAAIDLDWGDLTGDMNNGQSKVIFNNAAGNLSDLPGANGAFTYFVSTLSNEVNWATDPDNDAEEWFWGNNVKIDEDNNIAIGVENNEDYNIYAAVYNNPLKLSYENMDHMLLLSGADGGSTVSIAKLGGGEFIAVWDVSADTRDIRGRIFNADGEYLTDEFVIYSNANSTYEPRATKMQNGNIMVVWYTIDPDTYDWIVRAQIIDKDGVAVGSVLDVSDPLNEDAQEPDVATLSNGDVVFVYIDFNLELVKYRIYDVSESTFTGVSQAIDMYSESDYAGDYPQVAANDDGGFGVLLGGYNDDYDRVYFQAFDASLNPLYDTTEKMLVSDDNWITWWRDEMDLAYHDGYYHMTWDGESYNPEALGVIGIAYRRIADDGTKDNLVYLDMGNNPFDPWSPALDVDRNGVPVITWNKIPYLNSSAEDIPAIWAPIAPEMSNRVGICPDAQSLSEVGPSCTNLSYRTMGDADISYSADYQGILRFLVSNIEGGGVFVDTAPAIVIKDFPASQSVTNAINVSWYDLGDLAGGNITFYYDTDQYGFNGTAITGTYQGASSTNSATLDLSAVPNGTYYLYAVIDDGYYDPYMDYAPYSFTKNSTTTPTPTPSGPTPTPSGDTTAPSKVRITDIGLISGVADADYLAYYFTSQTPLIKGNSEALSTVYFKYGSTIYSTTAGSDGKYSITLSNPALPRSEVSLTYYAKDAAGNKSGERTLKLIIGFENFPQWLQDKLNGNSNVPPILSVTPTVTPKVTTTVSITATVTTSPIKTITPSTTAAEEVVITIRDKDGSVMANTEVQFDGKIMTTDAQGRLVLSDVKPGEHQLVIDGEVQGITISQGTNDLTAYFGNEQTQAQGPGIEFYLAIFLGGAILIGLGIAFLKKF